ncbi:hypothetical protein [Enterococcus diestrammenae]|uniref:hypothetical protein n=1 Tax=Enterococcus diestrammenae TaxID=1155073 RepID=UPI0022E32759|nr:hypothetical protein [Enterococcus diestrammenae]
MADLVFEIFFQWIFERTPAGASQRRFIVQGIVRSFLYLLILGLILMATVGFMKLSQLIGSLFFGAFFLALLYCFIRVTRGSLHNYLETFKD